MEFVSFDYDITKISVCLFTIADVEKAILKLLEKKAPAPGIGHFLSEHLIYAVNNSAKYLLLLFNACIVHVWVCT